MIAASRFIGLLPGRNSRLGLFLNAADKGDCSKVTCRLAVAPTRPEGKSRIIAARRSLVGPLRYNPRMVIGSAISHCKVAEKLETQVTLKVLAAHKAAGSAGGEG